MVALWGALLSLSLDSDMITWVPQLMAENGVASLPCQVGQIKQGERHLLQHALDGSEFWKVMGSGPVMHQLD